MNVKVPRSFAVYLRVRRLLFLIALIGGFGLLGEMSGHTAFFVGGAAAPGAALFFLTVSARHPLFYAIDAHGIALKAGESGSNLTGLGGAASSYWIDLRRSATTAVERHHWRQQPALLIRTQKNPRGYIVPFERADVEEAHQLLLTFRPA